MSTTAAEPQTTNRSPRRVRVPAFALRLLLAVALGLGFTVGTSVTASATDDYPHKNAADCSATFGVYSWCVNGSWYSPRLFAYRNCTDWVAWRLITTNGVSDFNNRYGGRQWGNANNWDDTARALGIPVNGTPARGAVAQTDAGSFGHVAWVSAVNGDGTVTVEEYNKGGNGTYGTRTVPSGSFTYIHIRDLANDNPFGAYDAASSPQAGQIHLAGWAIDPSSPTSSIDVHVYLRGPAGSGGAFQGAYRADASRPDVASAYPGSGDRHGYDLAINAPPGTYPVCVYAINVGAGTENPQLGCKTVTVADGDPFGSLDEVTSPAPGRIRARGWTVDPSERGAPTVVHLYVGGRAGSDAATGRDLGLANLGRPDVADAVPGAGPEHGFDAEVPGPVGTYPVCAYAINLGGGLNNTELRCLDVTVVGALDVAKPIIRGTAKVGRTLTADPGTWGPAPVALGFSWQRDGRTIPGATSRQYRLTAKDAGSTISATVSGSKVGYAGASRTSARTAKVAKGTLSAATPKISGKARVRSTLRADPRVWGPQGVTLTYRWKANGHKIKGATHSTLTLKAKQKRKKITVTVTGSKPGYTTTSKTSRPTGKVK